MESNAGTSKVQESRPGSKPKSASAVDAAPQNGLTSDEAHNRLKKFGPNAMPDTALHPLRMAIEKFWAPVPWMLEAAIILELALGKYVEAGIIAGLLVFNAAPGLFQESRAQRHRVRPEFFQAAARIVARQATRRIVLCCCCRFGGLRPFSHGNGRHAPAA
jgi:magnesium-transporting ATPase (P-type)